jgi:two-component system chemotaxis response regulator CheY
VDEHTAFDRALGRRLRKARRARGMSLLAVEVDSRGEFKSSALGCYERGERSLTAYRLTRLAELYDVPMEEVVSDDSAPRRVIDLARTPEPPAPSGLDNTVLVVDDDPTIRELVSTTLRLEGYDTVTAADGVMAVEILEHLQFKFVVLDTVMPRMDGLGVLRTIRGRQEIASTPVLVLSDLDDIAHLQHAVEAGASGYLAKPFELQALVEQVQRLSSAQEAAR